MLPESFVDVSSDSKTRTHKHASNLSLNGRGQRGKAGGFTRSENLKSEREKVTEANRESVSEGERA